MKLVVVGGGTAGWLTALFLNRLFPRDEVTVFASEEIGVVGAGEGSTPNFVEFMNFLGIDYAELFQNCETTIKQSILFENWSGDGSSYHHSFSHPSKLQNWEDRRDLAYPSHPDTLSHVYPAKIYAGLNKSPYQNDYELSACLHSEGKVPFIDRGRGTSPRNSGLARFSVVAPFAFHFNAIKLAEFFKSKAAERGITFIDDKLVQCVSDEDGNITDLYFEKNHISADFIFDCTGFHRLIVGRFYNQTWRSFSDALPCNSAQAFFKENKDPNVAVTQSIAMPYGWMWKIPLQSRYGCGYVYDANLVSNDEIRQSIVHQEGDVLFGKTFTFNPGTYEQLWVKNCIAIGLSGVFLEPLEATAIMQMINYLQTFADLASKHGLDSQLARDEFNSHNLQTMDDIVDFLYLHYLSPREDTEFWKKFDCTKPLVRPRVQKILELLSTRLPTDQDLADNGVFKACSFGTILVGNKILNREDILSHDYLHRVNEAFDYGQYFNQLEKYRDNCTTQTEIVSAAFTVQY